MEQNHKLALAEGKELEDPTSYRHLVGRLTYLTITRPDLTYVVHILSQFMQAPKSEHMEAAQRVVCYIKGSAGQGILLPKKSNLQLVGYCDSDWGACPISRRSLIGYYITLGNSPIS